MLLVSVFAVTGNEEFLVIVVLLFGLGKGDMVFGEVLNCVGEIDPAERLATIFDISLVVLSELVVRLSPKFDPNDITGAVIFINDVFESMAPVTLVPAIVLMMPCDKSLPANCGEMAEQGGPFGQPVITNLPPTKLRL